MSRERRGGRSKLEEMLAARQPPMLHVPTQVRGATLEDKDGYQSFFGAAGLENTRQAEKGMTAAAEDAGLDLATTEVVELEPELGQGIDLGDGQILGRQDCEKIGEQYHNERVSCDVDEGA